MLRWVQLSSPDNKKNYFHERSSFEDLWIVSHIEAKKWIQNQYLKSSPSIPTQTVLRAAEYWKWLFSINCSDWRLVSESLIYVSMEEWFAFQKIPSQYADIELFFNAICQMAPVLLSPQKNLLSEWLEQDPQREQKLRPWVELVDQFLQSFLEKKWVGSPWALSFLVHRSDLYLGDHERLHIDLGLDLQHDEVDLILQLAKTKDVTVLVPQPSWSGEYLFPLAVYKRLLVAADHTDTLISSEPLRAVRTQGETSVLREVKMVVSKVRQLVDQGVQPQDIAIATPALEDYWPLLRAHFDVEGIPLQKRIVARAISLPSVQKWLAQLHLLKQEFEQSQLEAVLYMTHKKQASVSYRDFKKNFGNLYESETLRDLFDLPPAFKSDTTMALADFVEILYDQWDDPDAEVLNEVIDRLVKDMSLQDELTYPIWIKYLELVISQYEIPLFKEQPEGLLFFSLNALDWNDAQWIFVLGCEQKLLVQTQRSPLKMEDLFAIERDLGFSLPKTESQKLEFDLRWCLESRQSEFSLSHSETDFNGDPQLAAYDWMKRHHGTSLADEKHDTSLTRWDQIMRSSQTQIFKTLHWSDSDAHLFFKKWSCDQNLESYEPLRLTQKPTLSASQIQRMDQCSFVFYAEKILRLKPSDEYDLDIDPMYNGQILHAVLEQLLLEKPSLNVQPTDIERLYEGVLQKMSTNYPLQTFWRHEKKRQLNLIYQFLELEKEYRQMHPQVTTVGVEVPLRGYVTPQGETVTWSKESLNESSFAWSGKIDRLDQDQAGHYGIIDYKTSKTESTKGFSSWLKNSQYQMSIYAQAVESGLAEGHPPRPVRAAEYLFLKNKQRGSGYVIEDSESGFVGLNSKQKTISLESRQEHDQQLHKKLAELISQIEKGLFVPHPKDVKHCEKCQWSSLCRAPHLR